MIELIISVLTGLIFGLAPALVAAKPDLNSALKEGSRNATAGRNRLRQTLVTRRYQYLQRRSDRNLQLAAAKLRQAATVIAAVGREISREVGQGMRIRF